MDGSAPPWSAVVVTKSFGSVYAWGTRKRNIGLALLKDRDGEIWTSKFVIPSARRECTENQA